MEKTLSPLKAIRAKCMDCMCGSAAEVRRCVCTDCVLYPYRFGKNPYTKKREYTDEQREAMRTRLEKGRLRRKS